MKEQGRNLEDQISKEEPGKLPEKEFRVMTLKIDDTKPRKQNGQNARINQHTQHPLLRFKKKEERV